MSLSVAHTTLTLHGATGADHDPKQRPNPAILFKLSDDLLQDVKNAPTAQGGLHFLAGASPKIRLGKRTIDLTLSSEAFRHELYSASTESSGRLNFTGLISHTAALSLPERKQSVGSDAALAALQNQLASYKQEKEAKSVNISSNVVKEPRNRFEAAKEQRRAQRRGLLASNPASSSSGAAATSRSGLAPTSIPASDSAARLQAMKTPLIHLLAIRQLSREDILEKTKIPKDDLEEVLQKIGKQDQGKWLLVDRAYKDLDVWKFGYSKDDRQAAIDNAIRAYDRMRLGKDEKLWQMLLPKEERNKGVVLSKLLLGGAGAANRTLTPNLAAGQGDGAVDSKSAANTPRLGPSSTPKIGSSKSDATAMSKRLFSKDPKKTRAAEEAKQKKRKERETAASDKESGKPARKKQTTKVNNPKIKSAELVHSSSESEVDAKDSLRTNTTSSSQPTSAANRGRTGTNALSKAKAISTFSGDAAAAKARPKVAAETTPNRSGALPSKPATTSAKTSKTSKVGKATPNNLSAPHASSQHRSALSPQKPGSKPTVPSPLGAARPRVASDVSDRGALGVQRVRQGAETPKGLGITNGFRKRHDTVTSTGSHTPVHLNGDKSRKPTVNGTTTPKTPVANGVGHKDSGGLKRKAVDSPYPGNGQEAASKHRKTQVTSSQSHRHQDGSFGANSSNGIPLQRTASSDSAASIINEITFKQGVDLAQKFRDEYYPIYAKLYDEQQETEDRGETVPREDRERLWTMHRRLEQMKREIKAASEREGMDEN